VQQLRSQLGSSEQQLRNISSPAYLPNDREKAAAEQKVRITSSFVASTSRAYIKYHQTGKLATILLLHTYSLSLANQHLSFSEGYFGLELVQECHRVHKLSLSRDVVQNHTHTLVFFIELLKLILHNNPLTFESSLVLVLY